MATAATDSPASNPEAQLGDLVEPADDVIDPVLLELPKIHYPEQAKPQKLNVVVRVRVLVDERGYVVKAELQEPLGYGFDNAALSVAVRSRFIPATKGTVPVKMWTVLPIVYRFPKN
jgi:TonB family protein